MKKVLIFLMLAIGASATVPIGFFVSTADSLAMNLVARWEMNEPSGTRFDSSGNGNDLADNGGTGQASGKFGNAALFTGTEYLSRTDSEFDTMLTGEFTIAGWVYIESTSPSSQAVARKGASFTLYYSSPNIIWSVDNGAGGALVVVPLAANGWHSVCAWSENGALAKLQVDGGTVFGGGTGPVTTGTEAVIFGGDGTGGFNAMRGRLDRVRVWNRVLTSAERTQLANETN